MRLTGSEGLDISQEDDWDVLEGRVVCRTQQRWEIHHYM